MLGRLEAMGKLKVGCPGGSMAIFPPWSMAAERPHMAARDCKWRYRSMVQLCHLPMRRMRLLSTLQQNSAMATVERRQSALTSSARVHGSEFGIGPDDLSAGCLRSTGVMALFCGGVDSSCIHLLGRWQSWTMLRYLHLQSRATMRGLSAAMPQGGKDQHAPPGQPTFSFPRASRRPSMHHSKVQ